MQKKGFTLIELLAVVVILAVVATIAGTLIINIIDDSKKAAYKTGVLGLMHSFDNLINVNGEALSEIDVTSSSLPLENNTFTSGTLTYDTETRLVTANYVTDGIYCAYGERKNLIIVKGSCDLIDDKRASNIEVVSNSVSIYEGDSYNLLEGVSLKSIGGVTLDSNITYISSPAFNKDVVGTYEITYETTYMDTVYTATRTIVVNYKTYNIIYYLDNGTVSGNPATYTSITETFTINNPTKEGYVFTGWSETALGSERINPLTITVGSTGNKTYYAHYAELNTALNNVRYVKDCINGSSTNIYNLWLEIEAIYDGENIALGKAVIGTTPAYSGYNYNVITDGDKVNIATGARSSSTGLQCVIVDLEASYNLEEIGIWHYADGRTFYSNTTYVSSNNTDWVVVKNTKEAETSTGKVISAYQASDVNFDNQYVYVKNQIVKGDFSSATGWSSSTSGWTSSSMPLDNTLEGTVTSGALYISDTSSTVSYWNSQPTPFVAGHVYYLRANIKTTSITTGGITFTLKQYITSTTIETIANYSEVTVTNAWNLKSGVFTPSYSTGYLSLGVALANIAKGYIKEVMMVDLTSTFGSGNEPSKEWCDTNLTFYLTTGFSKINQ